MLFRRKFCLQSGDKEPAYPFAALNPGADGTEPLQTGKGHHFACTDYSGGKVFIVNTDGKSAEYP